MDLTWKSRKVVIVGAGAVGSSFAFALAQKGLADEITLLDANRDLAAGQVVVLAAGEEIDLLVLLCADGAGDAVHFL